MELMAVMYIVLVCVMGCTVLAFVFAIAGKDILMAFQR
ncbi:unnamed protein product, partial [marine sediment metagenome]